MRSYLEIIVCSLWFCVLWSSVCVSRPIKTSSNRDYEGNTHSNCEGSLHINTSFNLREGYYVPYPSLGDDIWIGNRRNFIHIDLLSNYLITGVETRGVTEVRHWINGFSLWYSEDCERFRPLVDTAGELQVFSVNRNYKTITWFNEIFEARCITLKVRHSVSVMAITRLQLMGCKRQKCSTAIGLGDKTRYPDSFFTTQPETEISRLGNHLKWRPAKNDSWLQIKLPNEKIVAGLRIHSRELQLTRFDSFTVSFSRNCMDFRHFTADNNQTNLTFDYQKNGTSKDIYFPKLVRLSCLRIRTKESHQNNTLQFDMLACGGGFKSGKNLCGRRKLRRRFRRIVGGVPSSHGQWPWLVSLRYVGNKSSHVCGAALIHPQWVITAAHCAKYIDGVNITDYEISPIKAWLGGHNFHVQHGTEYEARVTEIVIHPKFDPEGSYDIALLKLQAPVATTDYITSICLPDNNEIFADGTECYVSGWGQLNETARWNDPANAQHAPVLLMDYKTCHSMIQVYLVLADDTSEYVSESMRADSMVTENEICAYHPNTPSGACYGDSGGPLMCYREGVWKLVGIISWGKTCGSTRHPGVFARVEKHLEWIDKVIKEQ
ncbi:uncharacterized protein LOC141911294 [Tubulanus polymorphus]|uniref:uncharacterized protein LOC141911294 n=1 Tax=Tubulanus polymorphus TaxID=672921 RepID=UPI003DA50375